MIVRSGDRGLVVGDLCLQDLPLAGQLFELVGVAIALTGVFGNLAFERGNLQIPAAEPGEACLPGCREFCSFARSCVLACCSFSRRQRPSSRTVSVVQVPPVVLARKLLVALWKYATAGVLIEGAVLKQA